MSSTQTQTTVETTTTKPDTTFEEVVENVKAAFTHEPTTGEKVGAKIDEISNTVSEGVSNIATYGTLNPTVGQKIGHELDKANEELRKASKN